jgi:hypothetical protein
MATKKKPTSRQLEIPSIKGRSKSSKSILVISDMHVGSNSAICSDNPERDGSNAYEPSSNQQKLFKEWNRCLDELTQSPTALVLNGEPIDGSNPKSQGDGLWSNDFNDQMNDAAKLLKRIKREHLILTRGSGYHVTREATNFEKIFADKVGAMKYKSVQGHQTKTDYEATIEMFGKYMNFTHHIGYSGWWMYRPTPMARELVKMHFGHKENGFHTDVVVRSHVHYYCLVEFPNTIGFTSPAWKFPDGFMYRRGIPELPTIGMVEILIEPNGEINIKKHVSELKFPKPVIHL